MNLKLLDDNCSSEKSKKDVAIKISLTITSRTYINICYNKTSLHVSTNVSHHEQSETRTHRGQQAQGWAPWGFWVGLRLKTANVLALNLHYGFQPTRHHSPRSSWVSRTDRLAELRCPGGTGSPGTTPRLADTCKTHRFNNAANIIHFAHKHRRKRHSTFAQLARHTLLEGAGGN